jgi:TPR repeat protein
VINLNLHHHCLLSVLAVLFCLGCSPVQGQAESPTEKIDDLRKSAENGNASAWWVLGCRYAQGTGVPQDDVKAVECYRKGAEMGSAEAQMNLGSCYAQGKGAPHDQAQALKWFRKAAEQGPPQFNTYSVTSATKEKL